MDQTTEDEKQVPARRPRQVTREERARIWWAAQRLPDPAYDPKKGWTLEQFAMFKVPYELQKYKESSYVKHYYCVVQRQQTFLENVRFWDFPRFLNAHLLEFRVTGFRPGSCEPEEIPLPLLEAMHPIVELSELVDYSSTSAPRRYEHVRVFQTSSSKQSLGGRNPTYDFDSLFGKMAAEGLKFRTKAAVKKHCQKDVRPFPGKKPSPGGPDLATVATALNRYGFEKFLEK